MFKPTLTAVFRAVFLFAALAAAQPVFSQDMTTPLLDGSWQSTFSNPALLHRLPGKLTIGLPGAYNDLVVENLTYNDLLVEEDGRTLLDANLGIDLLEAENQLRNDFDFESVGLAIRGERWAFGFHHRLRYNGTLDYPKALAQVIWQGNAQFIGQTVDIAPQINISGYHELNLSAAYKLTDKLTIGGRVKYLSGIADISTVEDGRLLLTTDDEVYDLTLDSDYTVNSAGGLNYEGIDGIETNLEFANITFEELLGQNTGLGFDVGVQLDLGKIRLQASALDLGAEITWENQVTNYRLNGVEDFRGLDVLQSLLDDTTSFAGLLDTLEAQFEPTETSNGYTTSFGSRYLIGGELDVTENLTLGALLFYQDRPLISEPAIAFSGRFRFTDALLIGGNYSYRAGSAANIGANITAVLGPVNLLVATDNIVTAFRPKDVQRANLRIGLSLSFAKGE